MFTSSRLILRCSENDMMPHACDPAHYSQSFLSYMKITPRPSKPYHILGEAGDSKRHHIPASYHGDPFLSFPPTST